jgi:glycosyltransferase involved in cell wall biosynthesis
VRVALACDWFLKWVAPQAAALARNGAEVILLCRAHAHEFAGDEQERLATVDVARSQGVRVLELPGRLWDPAALPELVRIRRAVTRLRPQVVHAHDYVDPRAIALLPWVPAVFTVHDPAPHPGQTFSRVAAKRMFLAGSRNAWRRRARVIVVHSESLRAEVHPRPRQLCVVVPLGIEVHDEPLPVPATPTVGFFGRLEPYKGLDVLARAMPEVWKARPDVRLRVVGNGPTELPISDDRVSFERGYLPESEIERFFRDATLTVLPYTQASQSASGSLSVGYGVPVVATRLGGLPDLTLDETYLAGAGDATGLAAAIIRHIDDGADQRTRVLSEVAGPKSLDAAAVITLQLYEDLLAGR